MRTVQQRGKSSSCRRNSLSENKRQGPLAFPGPGEKFSGADPGQTWSFQGWQGRCELPALGLPFHWSTCQLTPLLCLPPPTVHSPQYLA